MNELAQHIESLLLENDCVVVPGLGGFIAHYISAEWIEEEHLFLPPMRAIGFNAQLKMNDGVLVQSYMAAYATNYSDATRLIGEDVDSLLKVLHEEGIYELPNVGSLHYSMHGTYTFTSYDYKLATPHLYGLDSFEFATLKSLCTLTPHKEITLTPQKHQRLRLPLSELKRGFSYISNVAAIIAVIIFSFLFSSPIGNTEVLELNSAQLFPEDLFRQISSNSLTNSPVAISDESISSLDSIDTNFRQEKDVDIISEEVKVEEEKSHEIEPAPVITNVITKKYHIIVASVGSEKDAHSMAQQLIAEGHAEAKAIILDGKKRVSIVSCATYNEAIQCLKAVNETGKYQGAWVLKKTF